MTDAVSSSAMLAIMAKAGERVLGLDGLRGLAILLVVVSHFFGYTVDVTDSVGTLLGPVGGLGVELFFVLSGFLITSIIVKEQVSTGTINFKKFYIRRTLRIWPAFYVFMATMAILAATDLLDVTSWELIAAGVFIWDYAIDADALALTHTWSIAIEEQFYLLWPAAVLWLRPGRALWFCVIGVAISPLVRVATYLVTDHETRGTLWQMLHVRADSLLVGCLLAMLLAVKPMLWDRLKSTVHRFHLALFALPVLLGSLLMTVAVGAAWQLTAGYTIENLAWAVVIVAVLSESHPLRRIMSWRPLTMLGTISFSLYLWQQFFLISEERAFTLPPFMALVACFTAAALSYLLVEKPVLKFKKKFEVTKLTSVSPGPLPRDSGQDDREDIAGSSRR